jgi:hypothetical protein
LDEQQRCIHCERPLRDEDQAIKMFIFAQSFGMRPRLKSGAEAVCFCPPCAVSLAFGPEPAQGALYQAAWRRLRELIGWNQAVTEQAWGRLHGVVNPETHTTRLLSSGPRVEQPFGTAARVAS